MEKMQNPFIVDFCEALIRKRGLELSEEAKEKEVEKMYEMVQNMLGRKLVEQLPEEKRSSYLKFTRDPSQLDLATVKQFFQEEISDPEGVMRETLTEFTDIYLKNR